MRRTYPSEHEARSLFRGDKPTQYNLDKKAVCDVCGEPHTPTKLKDTICDQCLKNIRRGWKSRDDSYVRHSFSHMNK